MAVASILAAAFASGCGGHGAVAKNPTTAVSSTTHVTTFQDTRDGFAIRYPGDWTPRADPQNVLTIDARANDANGPEIDIAVPKLGMHVPGLIPLPAVESGYVNDLRKRLSEVKVQSSDQVNFPGANSARRFVATGLDANHQPRKLIVLLLVRGDRLYIVTGEASEQEFDVVHTAFDSTVSSWTWTSETK